MNWYSVISDYIHGLEGRLADTRTVAAIMIGISLCTLAICLSLLLWVRDLRREIHIALSDNANRKHLDEALPLLGVRGDSTARLLLHPLPSDVLP